MMSTAGSTDVFDDSIHTRRVGSLGAVRVETDSLGSVEVPADAYWGSIRRGRWTTLRSAAAQSRNIPTSFMGTRA